MSDMNATATDEAPVHIVGENLSPAQYYGLIPVVMISSMLSILGSSRILLLIRRDHYCRGRVLNPYQRFMVGISINDIMFTTSCVLQLFLLPADIVAIPYAFGTTQTCTFVGFFTVLGATTNGLYNSGLSIQFWLVIVWKWSNHQVAKWVERPTHVIAWVWPLVLCLVAAFTQSLNPGGVGLFCTTAAYPTNCEATTDASVPCQRGGGITTTLVDILTSASLGVSVLISLIAILWVYLFYKRETRRQRAAYSSQPSVRSLSALSTTIATDHSFSSSSVFSHAFGTSDAQARRLKAMTFRTLFYCLAYLSTFLCVVALEILTSLGPGVVPESVLYTVRICFYMTLLLQGFFSCIVYTRPILQNWKRRNGLSIDGFVPCTDTLLFGRILLGLSLKPSSSASASPRSKRSTSSAPQNNSNNAPANHSKASNHHPTTDNDHHWNDGEDDHDDDSDEENPARSSSTTGTWSCSMSGSVPVGISDESNAIQEQNAPTGFDGSRDDDEENVDPVEAARPGRSISFQEDTA